MAEKTPKERIDYVKRLIAEERSYLPIMMGIRDLKTLTQSSAEVAKLRKDAYVLFYKQDLSCARQLLALNDPYAKSQAKSAIAYIKLSGNEVPKEALDLLAKIEERFPL